MRRIYWLLLAYWRTQRLCFRTRTALEQHQARKLQSFLRVLCKRSPYFAVFKDKPLTQWPVMDKAHMIKHFDVMNTAGLSLEQVIDVAMSAERSRDFTQNIGDITVGLSSGTSGQRGVFAVSAKEKAQWAGIILAKTMPGRLFMRDRVAFFLRANSNLYTAVRNPRLTFKFFDLFKPFDQLITQLEEFCPSLIIAPAQVLRQLALATLSGKLQATPKRVISVAEVLETQDRFIIERAFNALHEVYQATEGLLASTCECGTLHLNEEYVHIEPQWLDDAHRRFVPIITDFSRLTQPIVRYRLNDVLAVRAEPCPCGKVTRALDYIDGRSDDMLILPGQKGLPISVFADVLSRSLAQVLPMYTDYRLVQDGAATLRLHAQVSAPELAAVQRHLEQTLSNLGIACVLLTWKLDDTVPAFDPSKKRRRIVREDGLGAPAA